ncbi:NAD-dependent epimerase/dehydratase family protein [Synoicihabitans lomoniglobus]|uniref:NAD-dependent epimerase/dehydratase family protein n=1 Tax=Synoicihabitans lomoniglobus TaxID=2909285 RepID=A0AAF0I3U3_9BACT|nr:NAD-dependent epimerase/dehydratase family protein [Opitutaceae bacterium LMO-M01]WED66120.1 NAD-dependent epimerase/dehydratase family protein [Opitutaceae bacterium LMO-M01]
MSRVLITGAAGFIGSHTADQLLASGVEVVGVDNFRTGSKSNLRGAEANARFSFYEEDVAAAGALDALVEKNRLTAIIHLAALVSVQESMDDPALNHRLNVDATHYVAEAARRHGVQRVVFASSAAVYGETDVGAIDEETPKRPISPYGGAKLASEGLLLGHGAAYGFTVRCQRYFNVFGPRQDPASPYSGVISIFDQRYRDGRGVTIFGDGRQTRDFISVHDVARANVIAATRDGLTSGIANICTGRSTSLLDVAAVFARHYPDVPAPIHGDPRHGDIVHSLGKATVAQREMGFEATVAVADGLAELIESG